MASRFAAELAATTTGEKHVIAWMEKSAEHTRGYIPLARPLAMTNTAKKADIGPANEKNKFTNVFRQYVH